MERLGHEREQLVAQALPEHLKMVAVATGGPVSLSDVIRLQGIYACTQYPMIVCILLSYTVCIRDARFCFQTCGQYIQLYTSVLVIIFLEIQLC